MEHFQCVLSSCVCHEWPSSVYEACVKVYKRATRLPAHWLQHHEHTKAPMVSLTQYACFAASAWQTARHAISGYAAADRSVQMVPCGEGINTRRQGTLHAGLRPNGGMFRNGVKHTAMHARTCKIRFRP